LDKQITNSSLIFEGKVISKKSFFNKQGSSIYTLSKIQVYKYFKGFLNATTVNIISEGGCVGNKTLLVSPSVKLDTGNVGIFMAVASNVKFPEDTSIQMYKLYSGVQGFIKYDLIEKTANNPFKQYTDIANELYKVIADKVGKSISSITEFNVNNVSIPAINSRAAAVAPVVISKISPTVTSAGTNSIITITGTGFGDVQGSSAVNFKNADDGGKTYILPYPDQYLYWSNTEIQVKVPSHAGTGPIRVTTLTTGRSTDTLLISFSELNASVDSSNTEGMTNIVGLNYEGGLTWRMNVNLNADTILKASFLRALATWKCTTYINWKLGATTVKKEAVFDSINVITFGEVNSLTEGTLGVCYSYWGQCETGEWILEEADIVINPNASWEYGPGLPSNSTLDFESVILHELGHGHQLGHVNDRSNLMNYSIGYGDVKRTLKANNIAAGNDVLQRSTAYNHCGFPLMILLNSSNCNDLYIENEDNDFLIFPNPSSGYFNIAIPPQKQDLTISVYNSLGALLAMITATASSNYAFFDLSEYPSGMYFLRINNGEMNVTRKIILAK
jgi:hypothetical protein